MTEPRSLDAVGVAAAEARVGDRKEVRGTAADGNRTHHRKQITIC